MHIDEWLDTPSFSDDNEAYAKFVLEYYRLPAWKKIAFSTWMLQFSLFCTYNKIRYKVVGASRLGDILLNSDLESDTGTYSLRVDVTKCSHWSNQKTV